MKLVSPSFTFKLCVYAFGFCQAKKETVSLCLLAIRSGRKRTKPLSFMAEDTCDDRRRKNCVCQESSLQFRFKHVFNPLEMMIKQR